MRMAFLFALVLAVLASGCTQPAPFANESTGAPEGVPEAAYQACLSSCQHTRDAGDLMESGPCLLDPIPVEPDWVCDIAHSPRQAADNLPDNQCSFYREGKSQHFMELTPACEILRVL